jgi:hypothetical protein
MEIPAIMVMLMVLMNNMLLKHTWKTCKNRDRLGSCTITIQSHGHSSRQMIINLSTFLKTKLRDALFAIVK